MLLSRREWERDDLIPGLTGPPDDFGDAAGYGGVLSQAVDRLVKGRRAWAPAGNPRGNFRMRRRFVLPMIATLVMSLGGAVLAPSTSLASARSVNAWVTVKSTSPAVGCVIPVAIEVRESGQPLVGVDILTGLVVDGDVYASERAATGDDGVGYVDIDTSAAYAGGNAHVEVNLAGTYLGNVPVTLNESGGCESGTAVLDAPTQIWWTEAAAVAADPVVVAESDSTTTTGASIQVPNYVQQRNLSCEYASLQIATGAFGGGISEYAFDSVVGWSENPHYGYRGDITGWWGNTVDYGVYAEPLAAALPQFGFSGDAFYGQGDSAALTNRLDAGLPTLVWLGLWGDTGFYETGSDGSSYLLVPGAHVLVASGYDQSGVYLSDPALGSDRFFDWGTFMSMWNVFDGMGLAVAPA